MHEVRVGNGAYFHPSISTIVIQGDPNITPLVDHLDHESAVDLQNL
jgi:hypothetical protein